MNRVIISISMIFLLVSAGCQFDNRGSETGPKSGTPTLPPQPTGFENTPVAAEEATKTPVITPTSTSVDERRRAHLEEFALKQGRAFRDHTNLSNVEFDRDPGTANLTFRFELPDRESDQQEREFELTLEALIQSQYNWVVEGDRSYLANHITVKTDYGNGTISKDLLQRYIDGKLERSTVAYIWAGKFDPYTALGDLDNASHATRAERLAHTARVVERRMETEKPYTTDVETAIEDETLYVAFRHTEDTPNPTWSIGDTVRAYRETVTEFGVEYMPYNGVRGYDYHPNGTADVTFFVKNPWITSEYVGIRPIGQGSLNAANSLEVMDGPHEGPP